LNEIHPQFELYFVTEFGVAGQEHKYSCNFKSAKNITVISYQSSNHKKIIVK